MKRLSSIERAIKDVPFFAERYANFVKRLENEGASSSTVHNYSYNLALICLEYGLLPEKLTEDQYVNYYNKLLKRKASGSHMLHAVYCVRKYFHLYGWECPLTANPVIPARRRIPIALSKEEVLELLPACGDIINKAVIGLFIDTGMRKNEVLNLELRDLDFDRNMILVREGKRRKDRYVPFSFTMQKVIRIYLQQYNPQRYLFEKKAGEPMPFYWPTKVLADTVSRTKIVKHVHCHLLRHTFAVLQLEMGKDIRKIQLWLGHKRLETTAIYLNIANIDSDQSWSGPLDNLYPPKLAK